MSICLETHDLTKIYPARSVKANDAISLTVKHGEIYGLLGANGAGKSTFVRMIMGLVQPTSGSIQFLGKDVVKRPEAIKPYVGYMSQKAFGLSHLTVKEVIFATGVLRGLTRFDARRATYELMEELSLLPHQDKLLSHLSLGLLRTVCFAIALVGNPPVLVLDEPTESLDVARRRQFWEKLNRIRSENGTTVILVTHNILEAEQVLDRMAIISGGRLLAEGSPVELRRLVDSRMRLEIAVQEQADLPPETLAELQRLGECQKVKPGRYTFLFDETRLAETMSRIHALGLFPLLTDLRVRPADLEDVYMKLAGEAL